MSWLETLLLVCVGYLLGSIPSGYCIARWVARMDIRTVGSGNIGATNVARNVGLPWGVLVLFLDVAKAALPVICALYLPAHRLEAGMLRIAAVGLAVFLGNLFPVFLSFRGGKGVATALGVTVVVVPWAVLCSLLLFLVLAWRSRYVSLASILSALTLPIWALLTVYHPIYVGLCMILAVGVCLRHHTNIRALLRGQEPKF
jgi:glycerol-3-phosphate acyltransferase PlsY